MAKVNTKRERQTALDMAIVEERRICKFLEQSKFLLEKGKRFAAIETFDITKDALRCARYWLDEIWRLSKDKPTEEEFEIIEKIESAYFPLKNLGEKLRESKVNHG